MESTGGVVDSRVETAIDDDNCDIDDVTSGIENSKVVDTTVDTAVIGVDDSTAEAALHDDKCEGFFTP